MSIGKEKRQRSRSTRARRTSKTPATDESTPNTHRASSDAAAREHYRREKAQRAHRVRTAEHPLEQARRAYDALLAADAERARGGRPKKNGASPVRKHRNSEAEGDIDIEK